MALQREKLKSRFLEEYQKLNEDQRRAVDRLEGPVMVIAGPGTGKTQILASRIGKILLDTDAQPDNILCLTYTDAGVVAMRKRLLNFIGPDAYKVRIHTFHAFCNEVIQENTGAFEKTSLDPISELESIELYKKLIDAFPNGHPLKRYRGDVYYEISNLQRLFGTMKREGWTPEFIESKIDAYLDDLPNREAFIYKRKTKEFNAGDLKVDALREEQERMDKLRSAVQEFPRFQDMMLARKRYDFDDMINWVIRAFEENKTLLARYQEQFLYILVDEYQDTSGTQNRIVELLIQYWDKPNVFVVGDDDQSIYRFQGANVENMLTLANRYREDLYTVVLQKNYRSIQPILDLSQALITRNRERLVNQLPELTKELQAANARLLHVQHPPKIIRYETQREEMIGIARQVAELVTQGTAPGRVAVIYRENKYGEELQDYFRLMNIPVYSKRSMNLLDIPLARKLVLALRYLESEQDTPFSGDEMLFELLHADWFGIKALDIAILSMECADKRVPFRKLLVEKSRAPQQDLFTPTIAEPLQKAALQIESWISAVPNLTLQQLVETIIRTSGLLAHIMQSPDRLWLMQVLTGFFDFVRDETRRNPSLELKGLVRLLELMEEEEVRLPLVQVSGNDKGVNLLTAHGAKGLEFEQVFLAGANAQFWEKKRKPSGGYKLPDTLFDTASAEDGHEELRRLFYVAVTRAEQHLHISHARFRNDGKEMEPSMFVEEIREGAQVESIEAIIPQETLLEFSALRFGTPEAPQIERMEEEYVSGILDKFVMNVTALNTYLRCPLEFYYNNLVRIPAPKSETLEFGSAVHTALEQLFRRMKADKDNRFPDLETFLADFRDHMQRHRESFTREQFERRMEYGTNILTRYYQEKVPTFNKVAVTEIMIRNVVVDGVPIKGKLDKIEFNGHAAQVVDYKTGKPENARKKMKHPDQDPPNGGDYWRQAVFYKLLVDNYENKNWQVVSAAFDFVEPDEKKQLRTEKLVISPQDIDALRTQINTVWEKIQARDFYTGCGEEDCHWCNFVKTYQLAVSLESPEEEREA
jgi:DNA helicase-2/ATP-dependent DNA helicase PcrA